MDLERIPATDLSVSGDTAQRLAALDMAAEAILDATVPENTRLAFEHDWAHWERFCAEQRVPDTTVSASLLVAFVTELAHDTDDRPAQAPASITRRLSGVLDGLARRKVEVPHGITSDARKVIRAHAKSLARDDKSSGRGSAKALTVKDMRRMLAELPDTIHGIRDRAIITVGFGVAGRRSEIAALRVSDIATHPNGLKVRIRDAKTGGRWPAVRRGTSPLTCPVQAWHAWLDASGITEGPAFRALSRSGVPRVDGLSDRSIGNIVTAAGQAVGLELSGHSLRSGLATEARRAGHDAKTIAAQGGWKPNSATLYGYMQVVDEWTDNATEGIGL